MILVFAVIIGLFAGLLLARLKGETYHPIEFRHCGFLLLAAIPQYFAFFLPATREKFPQDWIPYLLVSSMTILFVFVYSNRREPMMWVLGLGLFLNFLVILANNGWMPVSPDTLDVLGLSPSTFELGTRHGFSKDMVMAKEHTHLYFLSDVLTLPKWLPYRVAFSIGDVIIGCSVIGILIQSTEPVIKNENQLVMENLKHDQEY
jgi:hypothetical protein